MMDIVVTVGTDIVAHTASAPNKGMVDALCIIYILGRKACFLHAPGKVRRSVQVLNWALVQSAAEGHFVTT